MGYSDNRGITTADDVPISELIDMAWEVIDLYNEADKGFVDLVTQDTQQQTFMTRHGEMTWEEAAEAEHARTGRLTEEHHAFNLAEYNRSLGYSRNYIEEAESDQIRRDIEALVSGGQDLLFEKTFDVMKNGIADGSELWYTPEDYGEYSFDKTHNHTFADTEQLFGDTNTHKPSDHVRAASKELLHHGKSADFTVVSHDFADALVSELTDETNYYIPEAEKLRNAALPDVDETLTPAGTRLMQTAWLTGDEFYVYDASNPIRRNMFRPMELTDNTGAPVGGAGGSRGDPGALLGAYGNTRFGLEMVDPLAGVKVNASNY